MIGRADTNRFRAAFLRACRLDVEVRKPGNVSVQSPGHGMSAAMFIAGSEAAAPALFARGARVGQRIDGAVAASVAAAGCNTNLGIVLLAAPIAKALEMPGAAQSEQSLQRAIAAVLQALGVDDARAAFNAIRRANPGGLGSTADQDVHTAPTTSLLQAMRLAADRDRIARQYASGYAELFELGLPAWQRHADDTARATLDTFIAWLSSAPDSHIVRKHGDALAQQVSAEAVRWRDQAAVNPRPPALDDRALASWDESLKRRRLNPGTSADLTVATAFIAGVLETARA